MNQRFNLLIQDLRIFFTDLRSLFDSRTAAAGMIGYWDDICHNHWRRTPLILTVAVHVGTLIFAIFGPMIITFTPSIPEVYMVELYHVTEQPPPIQKVVVKRKVTAQPAKPVPPPVIKPKAISLSPLKKRLAKEKERREDEKKRKALVRDRMEQVKLDFQKQQAEKEARKAASTAVTRISDLYRKEKKLDDVQAVTTPVLQPVQSATSTAVSSMREQEAIDRYKARLVQHIDRFWKLPELKEWSDDLECVMIIKVNRDGSVGSYYFKKRSQDHRFNQYVKKAVESAIPFPPFPLDLPQQSDEIYVTFYPGGLL